MICIPVVAQTTDEAITQIHRASLIADLVEVRVDYIKKPDLKKILAARQKPLIITVMPGHENGKFEGTEQERLELLTQALKMGADYIDVNWDCPALGSLIAAKKKSKIIVSYHNFNETPHNLDEIVSRMQSTGADIIKTATYANNLSDNLTVLDLVEKSTKPIIAICMGAYGEISRILAPLKGAYLTFASLEAGKESAPGQIPAETLQDIYRIQDLKPGFMVYGIIGNPVSKSKGYLFHNKLFKHYGLNSIYLNFLVDDIAEFAADFLDTLAGLSITMPHKQSIMNFLNEIDPIAEKIGAVNTVVNDKGTLKGYNTDMLGALIPLQHKTDIQHKRATLLGAGGAARAIAYGIIARGGRLTILNRTVAKAAALAHELGCEYGSLSGFEKTPTDILINMTSVGMHPTVDESPVDTRFVKNMVVLDGIYNPQKTRLLCEAEKNGCSIISGAEMFIHQAAEQFKLWTGIQPEANLLEEVFACN